MKSITIIILALAVVSWCQAEDDGQYHPEIYGDSKYYLYDNRFNSLARGNSKYGSIYYPHYHQALNRELQSPLHVNYGDSYEVQGVNTYPNYVTYQTPVVSIPTTYRPFVYSTPKPFTVIKSPSTIYHKTVPDGAANIIRQDSTADEKNYHFSYETDNGIAAEEIGANDATINGDGGTRVRGFYEYIGDDGLKYRVDYTADENGFRPSGAHLPRVPGTN